MNSKEPIPPEIFEDVINNFIIGENSLLINYIEVNDVKVEYDKSVGEHYILDVIVYLKDGSLSEKGLKGIGTSIKWSSFKDRLSQNKVFKNYLGLPLNNDYDNFYISIIGEMKEGYPKNKKIMETKKLIKRILREEVSNEFRFFRRRVDLEKVKKVLPINAQEVYHETKNYEQFKLALTLNAVEAIIWNKYEIGWEELPEKEEFEFVSKLSNLFEKDIKLIYDSLNQQ